MFVRLCFGEGVSVNTLVVYYSKTGNAKKVAEVVIGGLGADHAELVFDDGANSIAGALDPSGYERVILICPVWAFSLAEPMKIFLREYGEAIQSYSLIVTCGLFGLRGCVKYCVKCIGKPPLKSMKIRDKFIRTESFDVAAVL